MNQPHTMANLAIIIGNSVATSSVVLAPSTKYEPTSAAVMTPRMMATTK